MGILGICRSRMIVEGCKSGDYNMDFGKTGRMSTATCRSEGNGGADIILIIYNKKASYL
jgi:hypothetical protein